MTSIFTAIGNACIDLIAPVDDAFLIRHGLTKGLCRFVDDASLLNAIKSEIGTYQSIPGGAGANVTHVMSALGHQPHFISKIGADPEGAYFKKYMEENGVKCHFPAPSENMRSSQVFTFITPDGERTFLSFDNVAKTFTSADYDFDLLHQTNFLYLDGYCLVSKSTPQSFVEAANAARHHGGHVTFNIGDIEYYTTQKDDVTAILNSCDSVICNANEARVMFGHDDDLSILARKMSEQFLFGAITDGENGAIVFHNKIIAHVRAIAIPPSALVDTNGAGDHFSAGFIYGLMNGYDLEHSGHLGTLCSADCITHAGARPQGGYKSLKHLIGHSQK